MTAVTKPDIGGHHQGADAGDVLRRELARPFPLEVIDWKPQTAGWSKGTPSKPWVKLLAYIDNRAIMDRLDDVCGVGGWRNEFQPLTGGGMLCGISIKIDREWVTKWDGSGATDIESVKGALSGSQKRAAVQWGIGRYLYHVDVTFGRIAPDDDWNAKEVKPKDGKPFRWLPPNLPAWALPDGSGVPGVVSQPQAVRGAAAAKALEAKPSADVVLPGTRAHFNGNGGKRLKDVQTAELQKAQEQLRGVGTAKYDDVVGAIGEVLADRASAGA